jgi:hypothetical protein
LPDDIVIELTVLPPDDDDDDELDDPPDGKHCE